MTYSDYEQRELDIASGKELDRVASLREGPGAFKWGEDYGKDLLTDLNQLAHEKGTDAVRRDAFQRAYKTISRERTTAEQMAEALRAAPRPFANLDYGGALADWSVRYMDWHFKQRGTALAAYDVEKKS